MLTILIAQRLIKFATSILVHVNVILVLDLLVDNVLVGELTISYLYLYFSFKKDLVKGLLHVNLIHDQNKKIGAKLIKTPHFFFSLFEKLLIYQRKTRM